MESPKIFSTEGQLSRVSELEGFVGQLDNEVTKTKAEQQDRIQAQTLADVTAALTSRNTLTAVLQEILEQLHHMVPYCMANIALLEGNVLRIGWSVGYEQYGADEFVQEAVQPLAEYPVSKTAVTTGLPFIVPDTSREPLWVKVPQTAWIRSHLALPIQLYNKVIGILQLDSDKQNAFTLEDAERLKPIANTAAIALENARLFEIAQKLYLQARQEISERKQAEITLHIRDRALASARNGIIITDATQPDDPIIYCNPAFEKITGYSEAEVLGRNCRFLQGQDTKQKDVTLVRDAIRLGQECRVVLRNYRKDGSLFWNELHISPVRDETGVVTHFIGVQNDITQQMESQMALRESEERYRSIVSAMAEGVVIQDRNGRILTCNHSAEQILGLTVDQMAGRSSLDPHWQAIHEDGSPFPGSTHPAMLTLQTGQPHHNVIMGVHKPDDTLTWISVNSQPLFQPGEATPYAVVASFSDITEQRRTKEAMHHTQKLESLGILAGGVAHDFNNLLAGIVTQSSLALLKSPPDSPIRKNLEDVLAVAERATDLTRQLLAYSGKGEFQLTAVNLNDLVQQNQKLLDAALPKNIILQYSLMPHLPLITAEAGQIQQVAMNLILNAAEAYEEQAGVVKVFTDTLYIEENDTHWGSFTEAPSTGHYVSLVVVDRGKGIDAATLSRIFDPFFTTKFTGRGLGLAAVQGIVKGHSGAIRVFSQVGQGTTFQVLFPVRTAPLDTESPTQFITTQQQGFILLVDDERSVRQAIAEILQLNGHQVLTAENGQEGVRLFQQQAEQISLVLLDLTMPVMGGREALAELRQLQPNLPAILLSGYDEKDTITTLTGTEFTRFLKKPFKINALLAVVQEVLNR